MLVKGFNLVERSSKILLQGLMNVITMLVGSGNSNKKYHREDWTVFLFVFALLLCEYNRMVMII